MNNEHIIGMFARLMANGYRGGAVSTSIVMDEARHLARLSDQDGITFAAEIMNKRDDILIQAGMIQDPARPKV